MLKWTIELPTQEGWYFLRAASGNIIVRRVFLDANGTLMLDFGKFRQSVEFMVKACAGTQWAGPIPEPEE